MYPIAEKVRRIAEEQRGLPYIILNDGLWQSFLEEHPGSIQVQYKEWGLPRIFNGGVNAWKPFKRGIPCLLYRHRPVVKESQRKQIERYFKRRTK